MGYASCRPFALPRQDQRQDHPPPHFHVLLNDGQEAWVTIAEQKIVHSKVAAREITADVLTWAADNRAMLAATFEELQR